VNDEYSIILNIFCFKKRKVKRFTQLFIAEKAAKAAQPKLQTTQPVQHMYLNVPKCTGRLTEKLQTLHRLLWLVFHTPPPPNL
jgi:hypothetical protein